MQACSILLKTTQTSQWNYLEEQKVIKRINPKSAQLKSEKGSCTGYTGVPQMSTGLITVASFRDYIFGREKCSSAPVAWNKSTGAFEGDRLHRCLTSGLTGRTNQDQVWKKTQYPMIKHRPIHSAILQRACFWAWEILFSTGYTVAWFWITSAFTVALIRDMFRELRKTR